MGDDAALAAVMDLEAVKRAHGFYPLRVKKVIEETYDTRSFVFDVPHLLDDAFRYRAGQFCTFRVRTGDEELLRSYSMSSAPETDADLTVTVKRVVDGRVSNWFNDHVAEGDIVEATRPAGAFCVRDEDHPVVAFCGGSGITPVMSIAKSLMATTSRPMRLLFANRDARSVIFRDELDALRTRRQDRFDIRYHFDADAGFLVAGDVASFAEARDWCHFSPSGHTNVTPVDADFFICGPQPFMDLVETTLLDLGVDPDNVLIERFTTPGDAPARPASRVVTPPEAAESAESAESTESVTLILKGEKSTVGYRAGDTILETARRGGLHPPFSCEAGDCATCMALIREGSVLMRANNALTPDEVAEGWVLTCQGVPQGRTLTVEYEPL